MDELLTVKEAANKLTVSTARIRAMLEDGLLVGEKDGRDWMITAVSIDVQRVMYGALSRRVKLQIVQRDGGKCRDCQSGDVDSFHIHHIKPRAEGGTNDEDNLITLCCDCHKARHSGGFGSRLPEGLKGITFLREMNTAFFRKLEEPLIIHDGTALAQPLVVFVPYRQFLEMQTAYLNKLDQCPACGANR